MPDKTIAERIEEAKEHLESGIEEVLRRNEESDSVRFDITFDEEGRLEFTRETGEIPVEPVRELVDEFHGRDEIIQSGVQVRQVTAIDSDADGEVAVNVRYVYTAA